MALPEGLRGLRLDWCSMNSPCLSNIGKDAPQEARLSRLVEGLASGGMFQETRADNGIGVKGAVEVSPAARRSGEAVRWKRMSGRRHSTKRRIRKTPGAMTAKACGNSAMCRLTIEAAISTLRDWAIVLPNGSIQCRAYAGAGEKPTLQNPCQQ